MPKTSEVRKYPVETSYAWDDARVELSHDRSTKTFCVSMTRGSKFSICGCASDRKFAKLLFDAVVEAITKEKGQDYNGN